MAQLDAMDQILGSWLWDSTPATLELVKSTLFKPYPTSLSIEERTRLTYKRASAYSAVLGTHSPQTLC
jgi:acyl-CoA oxidase